MNEQQLAAYRQYLDGMITGMTTLAEESKDQTQQMLYEGGSFALVQAQGALETILRAERL